MKQSQVIHDYQSTRTSLHEELLKLVQMERRLNSKILTLLQQVEDDRSYLAWGYSNLFQYLVQGLGYSEALAYQRKAALKICKTLPEVKAKLDQGSLSLTTLARANKILNTKTKDEKRNLISDLENKTTRQIDQILARENPGSFPIPRSEKRFVTGNTVRVTIDLTEEEFASLERLKALKSHTAKNLKEVIVMLAEKELEKYNRTSKFSSKSKNPRQIKVTLKNHLLQKAKYKCQFPGCEQDHFLQVDHIQSVSKGGNSEPSNLQILCQAHNRFKYLDQG
jgi:hypothetical protein